MADIKAQLREVLPFLKEQNQTVRYAALQALAPHSVPGAPGREVFFEGSRGGLASAASAKNQKDGVIAELKTSCRYSPETAHEAFKILINLSDSALLTTQFAEPTFLAFLVSYIANPTSILADLAAILLANTTSFTPVSSALVALRIPLLPAPTSAAQGSVPYYAPLSRSGTALQEEPYPEGEIVSVPALAVLVDAFVRAAEVGDFAGRYEDKSGSEQEEGKVKTVKRGDPRRKADLHFLASVFINVTGTVPGREFFLTPTAPVPLASTPPFEYPLSKLTAFTEHPNGTRRRGVAATIRNCAFLTAGHKALLAPSTTSISLITSTFTTPQPPKPISAPGINALPSILLPLTGPEEYDLDDLDLLPSELQLLPPTKRRDPDPSIRLAHVETLLLFCTTAQGREALRKNGVYPVIKALHLAEEERGSEEGGTVGEAVVRLVNLLKREESSETEHDGDEYWFEEAGAKVEEEAEDDDDELVEIA